MAVFGHDVVLPLLDQINRQLSQLLNLAHSISLNIGHQIFGFLDLISGQIHLLQDFSKSESHSQAGFKLAFVLIHNSIQPSLNLFKAFLFDELLLEVNLSFCHFTLLSFSESVFKYLTL
jgi:hypothetical protein